MRNRTGREVASKGKPLDTIVGCGAHCTGVMRAENSARIEGVFTGDISCNGTLTISAPGAVKGDLEANVVVVRGSVHSTLRADELHLDSQARFFGDIHCRTLFVADGAFFHGRSMPLDDPAPERPIVATSGLMQGVESEAGSCVVGRRSRYETCK